jgi:hypothetical protein
MYVVYHTTDFTNEEKRNDLFSRDEADTAFSELWMIASQNDKMLRDIGWQTHMQIGTADNWKAAIQVIDPDNGDIVMVHYWNYEEVSND